MIKKVIDNALKSMEGEFSIVLKDLKSSTMLYEKNADKQLPSASTIKILIMLEAYRSSLQGQLDLDRKVCIDSADKVEFSLVSVINTDQYTIRDLILLMMTVSDNTATNVIIDMLGIDNINNMGKALGLKDTILQRKMMDFDAAKLGRQNLTTPRDMVMLLEKLYNNELLTQAACSEVLTIMSIAIGRDYMIRDLPVSIRVAHKTGELDRLNHDIGIVYTSQGDYALGLFATGLKDNIYGRKYIAQLSKEIFDHIYT